MCVLAEGRGQFGVTLQGSITELTAASSLTREEFMEILSSSTDPLGT